MMVEAWSDSFSQLQGDPPGPVITGLEKKARSCSAKVFITVTDVEESWKQSCN
ncbi:hypothetical protein RchiOBHm_Chr5g0032381 [Rosa chinensis]|uniref:Uncharacterized protein n=1 Tax=Rosa chinensis TaxID=74649 RepID=A0A2P6QAE7_ROSCH|nr:hypothetical protein RchiOBHm_Chr5g0032381 [Rosa chinensis]